MQSRRVDQERDVKFIGEPLMARDAEGNLRTGVATIFPFARTVVTLPGIHATQRLAFIDSVNNDRTTAGLPALTEEQAQTEMELSVDLFVNEQGVIIRPDPAQMDLAIVADELLETVVPKRQVKYMLLSDRRVRDVLKRRGECWRIFLPPTAPLEIRRMIAEARTAIQGRAIYYYSPVSGTRLLTYDQLRRLADLDDAELRSHLVEIADHVPRRNRNGYSEIELFMADYCVSAADITSVAQCTGDEFRPRFNALCSQMRSTLPADHLRDDLDEPVWRNAIFARLMTQRGDVIGDEQSMGLDPEFSMRVEWLPGGRLEEGELIIDPALEERYGQQPEKPIATLVRGLIFNLVREYGDLEYINLGSVLPSPRRNEQRGGRHEVFVAQIKQRRAAGEMLKIIRIQKWGIRERLDKGASLQNAMIGADEYTEYVLDRRLACRQLGMNLPLSQSSHRVSEVYTGVNCEYSGWHIWTPYFQRDYIPGFATDQMSARKLADPAYAAAFALLFGQAAASNMIVGRAELTGEAVFDVGDEIVIENAAGLPVRIVVADHVGTFVDWKGPIEPHAVEYARSVRRHLVAVPDPEKFISAFLTGVTERFIHIQREYERHRRAFDTLFNHRQWNSEGSVSCRWFHVLERLRRTDAREVGHLLGNFIRQ
jgi:hypothetical protein